MDIVDIIVNNSKYGFMSFEEFKRNYNRLKDNKVNEMFGWIDKGGEIIRPYLRKILYEIEGYRCKTLEEVERVAKSQGIDLTSLDYQAVAIPQSSYKCDVLIRFLPKKEILKRNGQNG